MTEVVKVQADWKVQLEICLERELSDHLQLSTAQKAAVDCDLTELICVYFQLTLELNFEDENQLTLELRFEDESALTQTEQNWEGVTALKPKELN